jgi:hypothetical protein
MVPKVAEDIPVCPLAANDTRATRVEKKILCINSFWFVLPPFTGGQQVQWRWEKQERNSLTKRNPA